jgi:hypothetical protein
VNFSRRCVELHLAQFRQRSERICQLIRDSDANLKVGENSVHQF